LGARVEQAQEVVVGVVHSSLWRSFGALKLRPTARVFTD